MTAEHGPLPSWLGPLASIGELAYARAVTRRNARYDRGAKGAPFRGSGRSITFDRPVICVGNLSVGGTGKTPAVHLVCRWLIDAGHRPAIALRGYAARGGLSDEAELHRAALPGVPLAIGGDRVQQLIRLFASEEGQAVDVVVLDDGFQHRRLARQLDVVLIDATRDPFAERLLPAGWLREPVGALARAHAVVLTHADRARPSDASRIESELSRRFPHLAIARAAHTWTGLRVHDGGDREEPLAWLRGRRYAMACAIGKPEGFIAQAGRTFGPPTSTMVLRDHDPYAPATVERLRAQCAGVEAMLVTEKDWTKLGHAADGWPCPIVRPRLELGLLTNADSLRGLILEAAAWHDEAPAAH
jgi:tetraacyldisaccharide 4'-kinase